MPRYVLAYSEERNIAVVCLEEHVHLVEREEKTKLAFRARTDASTYQEAQQTLAPMARKLCELPDDAQGIDCQAQFPQERRLMWRTLREVLRRVPTVLRGTRPWGLAGLAAVAIVRIVTSVRRHESLLVGLAWFSASLALAILWSAFFVYYDEVRDAATQALVGSYRDIAEWRGQAVRELLDINRTLTEKLAEHDPALARWLRDNASRWAAAGKN